MSAASKMPCSAAKGSRFGAETGSVGDLANPERLELTVTHVKRETQLVRALTLAAPDGEVLPGWRSGAHVNVQLPDGQQRSYSLVNLIADASATTNPRSYLVGVRLEESGLGGSRFMHGLEVGNTLSICAPRNNFPLECTDRPVHLIAGGIGITPLASMASELIAAKRPFRLHYAGRSIEDLAFLPELRSLSGEKLILHGDDRDGQFPLADVMRALVNAEPLYLCGPRPMIDSAVALARELGWSKDRLHFEIFSAAQPTDADDSFEVVLKASGRSFQVPKDKTILDVLIEAGLDTLFDCRRGDCGICQAAVIEGIPDHRDYVLSDEEKSSGKLIQICVSRSKSPRLVLDL
ncbi:PDR/VanB family oxidoreductase [Bradyrhizobium manausense]